MQIRLETEAVDPGSTRPIDLKLNFFVLPCMHAGSIASRMILSVGARAPFRNDIDHSYKQTRHDVGGHV